MVYNTIQNNKFVLRVHEASRYPSPPHCVEGGDTRDDVVSLPAGFEWSPEGRHLFIVKAPSKKAAKAILEQKYPDFMADYSLLIQLESKSSNPDLWRDITEELSSSALQKDLIVLLAFYWFFPLSKEDDEDDEDLDDAEDGGDIYIQTPADQRSVGASPCLLDIEISRPVRL